MSTATAPAYRVAGPRAISGDWRRFWHLTLTLAYTDWKLRFFGSVLGYLWQLIRPLLLFGVLYADLEKLRKRRQRCGLWGRAPHGLRGWQAPSVEARPPGHNGRCPHFRRIAQFHRNGGFA